MYVDIITKKVKDKIYTRYLIRDSHWENGKIKHATIANISKCSPEEIQAIRLALKYKGNISDVLKDSDEIQVTQGLSVGAVFSLYKAAQDLGIVKAMGNTEKAKLALWMVISR
ncbi:MAG: IS1634 family transposase, partial [Thermoplasmata archaeon]